MQELIEPHLAYQSLAQRTPLTSAEAITLHDNLERSFCRMSTRWAAYRHPNEAVDQCVSGQPVGYAVQRQQSIVVKPWPDNMELVTVNQDFRYKKP